MIFRQSFVHLAPPSDTGASVGSDSLPLYHVSEFIEAMRSCVNAGAENFSMLVSRDLYTALSTPPHCLLGDIASNLGVMQIGWSYQQTLRGYLLHIAVKKYYAGKHIIVSRQNQKPEILSSDEAKTLDVALSIVAGISGSPLEKEKAIHDYLCTHVTYFTDDDGLNENDCAIGALLNGKADCDGYSDAFYLLGTLAGLEVRHFIGKSVDKEDNSNSYHMWNLVQIHQRWVMMDLTWNDKDPGTDYLYYNIGSREASVTHSWDARAFTEKVVLNTPNDLRNTALKRYIVSSLDDIEKVVRQQANLRAERICLTASDGFNPKENLQDIVNLLYGHGIRSCSQNYNSVSFEASQINYYEHFKICSSEYEALVYIQQLGSLSAVKEAMICLPGKLGQRLLADQCALGSRLLSISSLKSPLCKYSSSCQYLLLDHPEWGELPPLFRDEDSLYRYLRSALSGKPSHISFLFTGSLDYSENTESLDKRIFSLNVRTFSRSVSGGVRMNLSDIQYSR